MRAKEAKLGKIAGEGEIAALVSDLKQKSGEFRSSGYAGAIPLILTVSSDTKLELVLSLLRRVPDGCQCTFSSAQVPGPPSIGVQIEGLRFVEVEAYERPLTREHGGKSAKDFR